MKILHMKSLACVLAAIIAAFSIGFTKKTSTYALHWRKLEKSLKYIPGGSFTPSNGDGLQFEPIFRPERSYDVSIESFYLCDHEVTNAEYKAFLSSLMSNDVRKYRSMLPDTNVWRDKFSYSELWNTEYFRNPKYDNYPVIGVTYEQAEEFCLWLTETYAGYPKRKFRDAKFSLPSKIQWQYASNGGYNFIPYPWGSPFLYNRKCQWLANFHVVSQESIGWRKYNVETQLGDIREAKLLVVNHSIFFGESPPMKTVLSYKPNKYGLYNMAGNVEEMVKEKGISKGGGWRDTGYYLQNYVEQHYDSKNPVSSDRGFRVAMTLKDS